MPSTISSIEETERLLIELKAASEQLESVEPFVDAIEAIQPDTSAFNKLSNTLEELQKLNETIALQIQKALEKEMEALKQQIGQDNTLKELSKETKALISNLSTRKNQLTQQSQVIFGKGSFNSVLQSHSEFNQATQSLKKVVPDSEWLGELNDFCEQFIEAFPDEIIEQFESVLEEKLSDLSEIGDIFETRVESMVEDLLADIESSFEEHVESKIDELLSDVLEQILSSLFETIGLTQLSASLTTTLQPYVPQLTAAKYTAQAIRTALEVMRAGTG